MLFLLEDWLKDFGHDSFRSWAFCLRNSGKLFKLAGARYPEWIREQMEVMMGSFSFW